MNVLVLSSERNLAATLVEERLRAARYSVESSLKYADWRVEEPDWASWGAHGFRDAMARTPALLALRRKTRLVAWSDLVILIPPCEEESHVLAGWAAAAGKRVVVYIPPGQPGDLYDPNSGTAVPMRKWNPELVYGLFDHICIAPEELVSVVEELSFDGRPTREMVR